ncbi:hypothetical protein P121_gp33 [Pelagibacter phage HTVC121P]|nr:hypothetical protein P121_gp33 [Pelagibacter phage HTVC121P]
MCMRPKMPPPPVQPPAPVNTSQTVGEETAPELVTANEQDLNIKKKKVKKSGTSSLNTSSGLNISTSGGTNQA